MAFRLVSTLAGVALFVPLASAQQADKGKAAPMKFSAEEVEKAAAPSRALEKALKLYDNRDYYSATIELHKVVEGETGDAEANRQRAELTMGKALFHLEYFAAALSYFDRIVQKGDAHAYYRATLKWLASLSGKLPESALLLEKVGHYGRVDLDDKELEDEKDQLLYLMGRWHYTQGNLKDAVALFSEVSPESQYYIRAQFFAGVTHVRQYEAKPAAEAFKAILRVREERPDTPEIEHWSELAALSLARVFYSVHQWDAAVKYYDRLPQGSAYWLAGLFESSWAHYQMDNFQKALGNIHTLNAPYFETEFFPESLVLKAVIYWKNCLYERANDAIADFNAIYPPLKKDLDDLLDKVQDPTEFYEAAQKIRTGKDSGLREPVERLARSYLADRTLKKQFDFVEELDRELAMVKKADPAWQATAIASAIIQDLTLQQSLAKNDVGGMAKKRIERGRDEIQDMFKQTIKIEFETINALKGQAEAELKNEQVAVMAGVSQLEITADDEHEIWPFEGEYWKDELGSYRFRLASQCGKK
jgi:outer membrane protein assembly factor BamD (BamD/ComL family)